MRRKVFGTIREAIHATATANGSMKTLAAELDWSPSELSRRTTLGDDNALSFPADDRLVKIQRLTGDHSILLTMAEALGYEVRPKQDRLPEILDQIQRKQSELSEAYQLVLSTPWVDQKKGR